MPLTSRGFPLFLTFDLDAETMWTARDPAYAKRPILMSQGAYGWKVGTLRILDLLDRYGLKVTFFVPGLVIDQREALMEEILERGHEIAHHSYSHTWILNLTPEQEREEMEKGFQSIKRVSGRAPHGWRSPAAELSAISMPLLVEYGFDYSSNFFDDDSPYLHNVEGRATKIVELPFRWVLDDAPFFQYSIVLPGRTTQAPSAVMADAVKASAAALGGLDGVVNAAGVDLYADIEAMAQTDWERVLAVNLTAPFLVTQAAYPYLKAAGGGTIVNVSSAAGLSPLKNRTAYCASKAGLQMASKALAIEAAAFDIRVNTVCPGAVETELFRSSFASAFPSVPDEKAIRDAVRARYALNRIAEPEEIAAAIVWLRARQTIAESAVGGQ
jgi:NAD(P)-dependent dehydrogenase (short-subunit alcohol dehydrogenase family)